MCSRAGNSRSWPAHLAVTLLFATSAVAATWPLALHLGTHLPGRGPGDNLTFVWNFWWMRHTLAASGDFFHTTYLFYPFGADLTLHTHSALAAVLGATLLSTASIVTAQNVVILASYALNGFASYLLAWTTTRHRRASVLAGLYFQASPYFSGHLLGHFNLIGAWGLPLFALMLLRALERQSVVLAAASGVILGLVAYTDYYYVIYVLVIAACLCGGRWVEVSRANGGPHPPRRYNAVFGSALGLIPIGIVLIWTSGGGVWSVGSVRLSMTTGRNLQTAGWIVLLTWLWVRWRPGIHVSLAPLAHVRRDARLIGVLALVAGLGVGPLAWRGLQLWIHGDYVSQQYFWSTAPPGVDLASLLVGNPFHPIWGHAVERLYAKYRMLPIESTAWFGVAPVVWLAWTRASWLRARAARRWLTVGSVFFLWALGPRLTAFGFNTGLLLPATLVRFVPIVANARIPGRAIVVVYMAASVLLAMALAATRGADRRWVHWAIGAVTLLDFAASPFPLFALDQPRLYLELASLPEGAVIDAPFGVRDGFGELGSLDHRMLYYQSIHGKPLVGGFAARVPESLKRRYLSAPGLGTLLRLSAGAPAAEMVVTREDAAATAFLRARDIRYIVLNTNTATADLKAYVRSCLRTTLLATEHERELYVIR